MSSSNKIGIEKLSPNANVAAADKSVDELLTKPGNSGVRSDDVSPDFIQRNQAVSADDKFGMNSSMNNS